MSRFIWPTAWVRHHTTEPYPVIAALVDQLQSRGWKMPVEMYDRMDRAANTILGGSDLKQSADLGQRKGSMPWVEMGVIRTRIADSPPEPDHVGDIALTNKMLATLQGFPGGWPFQGRKDRVFKQIANAFPAPVAMHLGCAIATALTGEFVDPTRHYLHQGRKAVRLPRDLRSRAAAPITPTPLRKHPYQPVRIPLSWLREAASET
jgi:DNA (cytosine-5)-methyltransferase 1